MMLQTLQALIDGSSSLFVGRAQAAFDTFTVSSWGYGNVTWSSILQSIVGMLTATIEAASVAVFVAGAFVFAISAGNEGMRSRGKNMMIGALIGLAIVVGAKGILNTVAYFVWGS